MFLFLKKSQQIKKGLQCNAIDLLQHFFFKYNLYKKNDLGKKKLKNFSVVHQNKNIVKYKW